METMMKEQGFCMINKKRNDSLNSVWLGTKRVRYYSNQVLKNRFYERDDEEKAINIKKLAII